jgi:Domain of unknown function (DU1801)
LELSYAFQTNYDAPVPTDPEVQIKRLLEPFRPEVRDLAQYARRFLQAKMRGGYELVYDNYDALAFGYSPTERTSEAVIHLAVYAKYVKLGFNHGTALPDPKKLLGGSGKFARQIRISSPEQLQRPVLGALLSHALKAFSEVPSVRIQTIVKAVSPSERRLRISH